MPVSRTLFRKIILLCLLAVFSCPAVTRAQGLMLPTLGAVNRSMGGAAVATPLDAISAVYWNPATMSALPASELEFGMDLLLADLQIQSQIPGFASGSTNAEPGAVPIPNIGLVHHTDNPRITYGLGFLGVGGFKTNYPADPTNPILAPAPAGLGRIYTEAQFLQMTPSMSIALSDNLSIGFGPTVTMGTLVIDPLVVAPLGPGGYPSGRGTRVHWGGGAHAGIYYIGDNGWRFGASFKTPQWMEEFRWKSEDAAGGPTEYKAKFDLPMIVSFGTSYDGIENWVFALDLRYFDYEGTDGFGNQQGFNPATGAATGLGFSSVFAMALGAQYRVRDGLYLRGGYHYNQSPIKQAETFFNLGAPLFYQHLLSCGSSVQVTDYMSMHMAYSWLPYEQITGPFIGAPPGSTVSASLAGHLISVGASVQY